MTESLPPSITIVRLSGAKHRAELPVLVLGPAYGASASSQWTECATQLGEAFDLLAWDLPGHGYNVGVSDEPLPVAELAAGVLAVVDDVLAERGELGRSFAYAGVGVGSEVGAQLDLDAPGRVSGVVRLGDVDPAESPDDVARLIRRQLLGEALPEEDSGATDRLMSVLGAEVEAARGEGLTTEEIRATLERVAGELGD